MPNEAEPTMAWVVVTLLGAWFVATGVYQLFMPRMAPRMSRLDPFRVVPAWRFFAGPVRDFRVEFRDRLPDGSLTPWSDMLRLPPRTWRQGLWNPESLVPDVLLTVTERFVALLERPDRPEPRLLRTRFTYRQLLWHAVTQPGAEAEGDVRRQFRVIEMVGGEGGTPSPRMLFASELHPVGRPGAPPEARGPQGTGSRTSE